LHRSCTTIVEHAEWEVWQDAALTAPLVAGNNKVRITTINLGQPNVDHLQVN
jgi:hypothetical protein